MTEQTKRKGTWLLWLIGIPVGLFLVMLLIGASVSPENAANYARQRNIDAACDQLVNDSALGAQRRTTREVCDNMKALAKSDATTPRPTTSTEIEAALADGRRQAALPVRRPEPLPKPPENLFTGYPQAAASSR